DAVVCGQKPHRENLGPLDILGRSDLVHDHLRHLIGHPCVIEVPQVAQERHNAHGGDNSLPRLLVHGTFEPSGQKFPSYTGILENLSCVVLLQDLPTKMDRKVPEGEYVALHLEDKWDVRLSVVLL